MEAGILFVVFGLDGVALTVVRSAGRLRARGAVTSEPAFPYPSTLAWILRQRLKEGKASRIAVEQALSLEACALGIFVARVKGWPGAATSATKRAIYRGIGFKFR